MEIGFLSPNERGRGNGVKDGVDVPAKDNILSRPLAEDNSATVDLSKVTVRKPNKSRPKDVTGDVKSKHDFIEGVLGLSVKSTSDISLFMRDFEEGKYPIWKTLDSKTRSQVDEALSGLFEAFSLDMKAFATNSVVSGKVTTPDVNVDANTQPCPNSTYSSLVDEPVCEGVDSGLAKDVSANANTTSPKLVGNGGDMRMDGTKVPDSFSSLLKNKNNTRVVQISELRNDECVKGAAVALPWSAIEEVSSRFENTLYGYFVGKCLAFKLVENYVMNAWAKFGVKRVQSHGEFFLFQFETKEGMDRVIDSGPWLIRMVPLILNVWYPDSDLLKAEIKRVPVWVKLRHVPLVAYSEVVLSLITTQIGKPIRLDAYTSNMCLNSWGRSGYARALIEVSAEDDPKDELVIAIPIGKDKGHSLATICIEYEWTPPRCSTCRIFDHTDLTCPKRYKEVNSVVTPNVVGNHSKDVANDGFEVVKKKRNKMKKHKKQVDGVVLNKPSLTLHYRRVDKGNSSQKSGSNVASTSKVSGLATATSDQSKKIRLENSFSALNDNGDGEWQNTIHALDVLNESDSNVDVDEVITFDDRGGNIKIT